MARTFALIALVHPVSQQVCSYETIPNAPKHYETHQNMSLESNGVDRVRLLWKIPMWLCGTNFWTSLAFFALSVVTQPNYPKYTQIVWNAPKHEIRVEWGGSGVFVSKNSETTSWHELLHHFGLFCMEFCKATKQFQMHPNSTKHTKTWV